MKKGAKKHTAMSENLFNIIVEDERWNQALENVEELSRKVFYRALSYVKEYEEIDFLELDKPIEINLSLSNDQDVQKLNLQFRALDKPTNVLSFANIDDEYFEQKITQSPIIELGDIIIALETLQKEASEQQISLQNHYCHLLIHGILHLLGFDHQEDDEAEYMEDFEAQILQTLNINNPYEE